MGTGTTMWLLRALSIAALSLSPMPGLAQRTADGDALFENAWARAARKGGTGAAYFTIRNTGTEKLRLTDVRTDAASIVTFDKTEVGDDGVARMSAVPGITIQPGETLTLAPGGLHVMLVDLDRPLVEGETLPLRLRFHDLDEVTIDVPILGIAARGPDG